MNNERLESTPESNSRKAISNIRGLVGALSLALLSTCQQVPQQHKQTTPTLSTVSERDKSEVEPDYYALLDTIHPALEAYFDTHQDTVTLQGIKDFVDRELSQLTGKDMTYDMVFLQGIPVKNTDKYLYFSVSLSPSSSNERAATIHLASNDAKRIQALLDCAVSDLKDMVKSRAKAIFLDMSQSQEYREMMQDEIEKRLSNFLRESVDTSLMRPLLDYTNCRLVLDNNTHEVIIFISMQHVNSGKPIIWTVNTGYKAL